MTLTRVTLLLAATAAVLLFGFAGCGAEEAVETAAPEETGVLEPAPGQPPAAEALRNRMQQLREPTEVEPESRRP